MYQHGRHRAFKKQQVYAIFYQICRQFIKKNQYISGLESRLLRALSMVLTVLLAVVAIGAGSAWAGSLTIPQGAVGRLEVGIVPGDSAPWASFKGRLITFKKVSPTRFIGLVGVDMEAPEGDHPLEVKVIRNGASVVIARPTVTVVSGGFGVQHLTLPDKMVELSDTTLKRVKKEKSEVGALWKSGRKTPLWEPVWRMPVEGEVSGSFGKRRVINGQPRSPHNGEDIPAAKGTPVLAPNSGIVRLAKDRFFGGKTVFLEHGGGLFTFYMHLSEIDVKDGQHVVAGDLLGKVGASGRATGPHLHWGGRLNNARINPVALVGDAPALEMIAPPVAGG